jgi:hypothetical protein
MANMSLVCELVFCNDNTFKDIDSDQVKMLLCTSKYARENPNILREIARDKAYEYLDILYNHVRDCIIANKKTRFLLGSVDDAYIIDDDVIINDLFCENDVVREILETLIIHDYVMFLTENYIDAWGGNLDNSEFSKYYRNVLYRLDLDFEETIKRTDISLGKITKGQLIAEHYRL